MAIEKNQRIKAEDVRQGLTIWDPDLEYQVNATCYYVNEDKGIPYTIYRNITGNNTSTNPSEDTTNWEALKLGSGGANLPMFYDHRFPWKPQDESWINSENYSWLYKTPYIGAYDYLVKRYQPTGKFSEGNTYYVVIFSDGDIQTTDVTVASGTVSNLQTWATGKGYTTTGSSIEDLVVSKTLTAETETIADITITFYRCYDKKKIVLPTEIANVDAIYAATGIAEYFILDVENLRFKLPRNKWGAYGTGSGDLGDHIPESLPNITASCTNVSGAWKNKGTASGAFYVGSKTGEIGSAGTNINKYSLSFDASRCSSAYQDGAPVQPRGAKGDLYFYLGRTNQEEVDNISIGNLAEELNQKADLDLSNIPSNIDYVVESQLPTAENSYTWYRLYKSGWVEQGGVTTINGKIGSSYRVISLPIEMSDSFYYNNVTQDANAGGSMRILIGWQGPTKICVGYADSTSESGRVLWYVAGKSAQ